MLKKTAVDEMVFRLEPVGREAGGGLTLPDAPKTVEHPLAPCDLARGGEGVRKIFTGKDKVTF